MVVGRLKRESRLVGARRPRGGGGQHRRGDDDRRRSAPPTLVIYPACVSPSVAGPGLLRQSFQPDFTSARTSRARPANTLAASASASCSSSARRASTAASTASPSAARPNQRGCSSAVALTQSRSWTCPRISPSRSTFGMRRGGQLGDRRRDDAQLVGERLDLLPPVVEPLGRRLLARRLQRLEAAPVGAGHALADRAAPLADAPLRQIAPQPPQRAGRALEVALDLLGLERAADLPLRRRQPGQEARRQLRLQARSEHAEGVRLHGQIAGLGQHPAGVAQLAIVARGLVAGLAADQRQRRARALEPRPHLVDALLLVELPIARRADGAAELLADDPAHRLADLLLLLDPVAHASICIADGRRVQHR